LKVGIDQLESLGHTPWGRTPAKSKAMKEGKKGNCVKYGVKYRRASE
jgi:hypothetical protein